VERKGVQFLVEALDAVKPEWKVCIAGDGPYLGQLKEFAKKSPIPIEFLGFTHRDELQNLYASVKVFVFPSLQENFPMVLLEAMAGGCAIVTSSADGCSEVVGDAAIRTAPGDVEALRQALARLTRDEAEINRYRQLALERVQQFSSSRIAALYEDLFAQVIERNRKSPRAHR